MKFSYLIALSIVVSIALANSTATVKCHYSCETCAHPFHQYCKSCIEGYDLVIVKNPSDIPSEFRDTRIPTGVCIKQTQVAPTNALGIIILISSILLIPLIKSSLLFYIVSSMQSLSLLRFLQISWINPAGYILNAFQYLSPCNIITQDIKQNSWQIRLFSYFYVNEMFVQPDLEKSLVLVGSLDIAVFLLVLFIHTFRIFRRKYCAESFRQVVCISQWAIKNQINFLNCLYFFLIQQTILCYVVALQFKQANGFLIATIIIYSLMTLLFALYTYKFKIGLFPNRLVQYYTTVKKIIYPIFVVVPFQYQYFLIILMAINCVMEAFFDYKIKSYPFKSLQSFYKLVQFVTIIFVGIFYAVDTTASAPGPAFNMGIVLTIVLCIHIILFFVEVGRKLYENYQQSLKDEAKAQDQAAIPQSSVLGRDQHNNTLALTSTKREQNRESTQSDLMQNQKPRDQTLQLNESIEQPPKIQRSDTKDSSIKNSKNERKDITIEQISQKKQNENENENEKEQEKDMNLQKSTNQNPRKKTKNSQNLRQELKKRYGV